MRKIRWGVLGTADIARGQTIPGMQLADNCELYAIAGRNPEKAQQFQKEFGFRKAYYMKLQFFEKNFKIHIDIFNCAQYNLIKSFEQTIIFIK